MTLSFWHVFLAVMVGNAAYDLVWMLISDKEEDDDDDGPDCPA